MKIVLGSTFSRNPHWVLRRIGYIQISDHKQGGKISYVRPYHRRARFPRFHINLFQDRDGAVVFDIHFDSLRPQHARYANASEKDGPIVEQEVLRIKKIVALAENRAHTPDTRISEMLAPKKKGFFRRLFGL